MTALLAARGEGPGAAPRAARRPAPKARRLRILSIFDGGVTQSAGRGPRRADFARWRGAMHRRPNAGGTFTTGCLGALTALNADPMGRASSVKATPCRGGRAKQHSGWRGGAAHSCSLVRGSASLDLLLRFTITETFGRRRSRLAALLAAQNLPVSLLLAPCDPSASMRGRNYAADHLGITHG